MQPNKVSIPQLLADGTGFYVPFYQRAYVWNEKLWSRFLRDMEYISKTDEEYFIGSVILKKMGASGIETARWSIVDGQQRLTTLAIFYKVISLKDSNAFNPFDKRFRMDDKSLTIKHSLNDKSAFEKIANLTSDVDLEDEENSNVIKAYNYFRCNIDIDRINLLNIQARLWFIAIYLESNENEHKIFDTINSLGMNLNTEELLKNYLFTSASLDDFLKIWKPIFEADDKCLNYWKTRVSIGSTAGKTNSDRFFHTLLQIIMHDHRNNISREDRDIYRKYDDENEFNYFQKIIECGKWDKIDFAKEISDYAKLYRSISSKEALYGSYDSGKTPLGRLLLIVFGLEVNTVVPYILYLMKNVYDENEKNRIFSLLESYIVRRQICNRSTKSYSDLFTENLIGQQVLTFDELVAYLKGKKQNESLHMPNDIEIQNAFNENIIKNEKARCILYLMESKLRSIESYQTTLLPFNRYSLEHLMPQKWEENWSIPNNYNDEQLFNLKNERNHAILTLGNMAIITQGLNSGISNKKWSDKLSNGLKEKACDLITMKDVVTKSKWNEASITQRGIWMATQANIIWKNDISQDEIEEEHEIQSSISRDNTRYSLNGGEYMRKRAFVVEVVKAIINSNPKISLNELKEIFKDEYLGKFKRIGFICSRFDLDTKTLSNGRKPSTDSLQRWYRINDQDAWLRAGDNSEFVVSNQFTKDSVKIIEGIAEDFGWIVKKG